MTGKEETVSDSLGTSATALLTTTNGPAQLEPGQVLDERITIESLIGHGAMGEVYKARQRGVERPVAIKTLHLARSSDKEGVARFFREAKMLSALDHPNIVKIYAIGQTESAQPYLVLDYVEGPTLAEVLAKGQLDSLDKFVCVFEQLLEALVHAHSRGVVRRDIKPRNVILEPKGSRRDAGAPKEPSWRAHLLDFGIARLKDGEASQKLTRTGSIIGSPAYMSPEQCMGKTPDNRSDLYSMACVMYEALSGQPPFKSDNAACMMRSHVTDQATTLTRANTRFAVPSGLYVLIELALQKDPDARYQTADGMLEDLRRISAGSAMGMGTTTKCRKRNRKAARLLRPLLAMVGGFIMAAGILVAMHFSSQATRAAEVKREQVEAAATHKVQKSIINRLHRHWHDGDDDLAEAQAMYQLLGGHQAELSDIYADRAGLNHRFGNYANADFFYEKAIHAQSSSRNNSEERLADLRFQYANNLIEEHRVTEAVAQLKQADQYFAKLPFGDNDASHERILTLRTLIDATVASGCDQLAAQRYPELIKLETAYGGDACTICGTMIEYARVLRRLGHNAEAESEEAVARQYHQDHA